MSDGFDLIVLGAGPGGYVAAFYAADRGMRVALVDPDKAPGGVCLHRGCIPSKALLQATTLLRDLRHAAAFGLEADAARLDPERLAAFARKVVDDLTGGLGQLAGARKVEWIRGTGSWQADGRLQVTLHDGGTQILEARHTLVATGSHPFIPDMFGALGDRCWDSTDALALREVPGRLAVVGGGYIGLELGSVYAALGSEVTIVEREERLAPAVDRDLARILAKAVTAQVAAVHTGKAVTAARIDGDIARLEIDGGPTLEADRVLVAVGRRPNTHGLGLEHAGVELDEQGFVRVDPARRTTAKGIWAIGDAVGEPMLAHKASHEAHVAVDSMLGEPVAFEPQAIPAVIFTDPELATAGLDETAAAAAGFEVATARFPWRASGRAATLGISEGLTKLVYDAGSGRVLGGGVVGPHAGELIHELMLAVELAANIDDLRLSIHAHPTLSETWMEAAAAARGHATHLAPPRKRD